MDCSLLPSSSKVFKDSDLIDHIRQSYYDVHSGQLNDKEIEELLINALTYLDKDINIDIANELFLLIGQCFTHYQAQGLQILNLILSKSKFNKSYVIITAKLISYLKLINHQSLPNYRFFVENALKEILPQIQNPDQQKIFVFKHEIPMEFKLELIVCLLLIVDLTEKNVLDFLPYILSQNNDYFYNHQKYKIQILIKKVTDAGFINLILPYFFSNSHLYSILSIDDYTNFLLLLSDEKFQQFFTQIEAYYTKAPELNSTFALNLIKKCQLFNFKLKSIEKVFNFLSPDDLTPEIIKYSNDYDFVLSADVAKKFVSISDFSFISKIIPNLDIIPNDLIEDFIFNNYDYEFFYKVLQSTNQSVILTQSKFYIHLYNIVCQQKDKSTANFIKKISKILQNSVQNKCFNQIIDDIIFSNYPPNHQQNEFLITFINSFNQDHLKMFESSDHMTNLINRIVQENGIPNASILHLIDNDSVIKIMQNTLLLGQKINQKYFYLYHFSKKNKAYNLCPIKLNIGQLSDYDNPNLIDFINKNNVDLMTQLDEEALSLVTNALIFSENENILKIEGLTKENIVPFYAIVLKNWKKKYSPSNYSYNVFPTKEIQNLFTQSFTNLLNSESLLIKSSINSIILCDTNATSLFAKSQIKKEILTILINSLLNNSFSANKTVLFSYLFYNSNSFKDIKINTQNLFQYFINHLLETNYQEINYKMNFNFLINSNDIIKLFVKIIQNEESSETDVINCIYFIMNFCYNIQKINIQNVDNLIRIMQNVKDSSIAILINKFNRFYKISNKIPSLSQNLQNIQSSKIIQNQINDVEEILSPFLSNTEPEANDSLIYNLFKKMMQSNSLKIGYLLILFQKLDNESMVKTERFIKLYSDEYIDDKKTFIQSLNMVRILQSNKKYLLRKAKVNEYIYKTTKFEEAIIQNLFNSIKQNSGNYQAFFCLKSIACTFPFLFESKDQQIFNLVLPELDNYSLLFEEEDDDERKIKVKTSNAALSFLISVLHSNKIIDSFFVWLFNNISTFSNSAIYCFNFILYSALKTNIIKKLILSFLSVNKFIEIVQILMKRELQDGIFKQNYFYMIYLLLTEYYKSINDCNQIRCIEINYYQNSKDRFYSYFDHQSTLIPHKIDQIQKKLFIQLPDSKVNKEILLFMGNMNKTRNFWINHSLKNEQNNQIDQEIIDDFMREYSLFKRTHNHVNCSYPENPIDFASYTTEMAEYLFSKERWIKEWIFNNKNFNILAEHQTALIDVYKEMSKIKNQNNKNIKINEFNVENYFSKQYEQNDLFNYLITSVNSLSQNDKISEQIYETIEAISKRKNMMKTFMNLIKNNINEIKRRESNGEDIFNLVNKNMSLLLQLSDNNEFQQNFMDICSSELLQICLHRSHRFENDTLIKVSNIFYKINDIKLPLRVTHLIGSLFLTPNDENILMALKLCSKFTADELDHMKILKQSFSNEIKEQSIKKISIFLEYVPFLWNSHHNELIDLLDILLEKIKNNENISNSLIEFSFLLLNSLMPKREKKETILSTDSLNEDDSSFEQIPQIIFQLDEKFWSIFEKHRGTLEKMFKFNLFNSLNDDDRPNLLNEYPEFFSFSLRSKLFQQKMKNRINSDKELHLLIDPNNILESSFSQLHDLNANEWRNNIAINYFDSPAIDLGGVRRGWFIKLSKELFDPNYGLFSLTENLNLTPNRLSYANPEHFKYLNFAGKIVARALLQGENVYSNLSRTFLCQLLRRKVTLKDFEDFDEGLYKSFDIILQNDVEKTDFDDIYFAQDYDFYGVWKTIELKPNGQNIRISNENKNEYVDLQIDFYTRRLIIEQINSFCDGFYSIIPYKYIKIFTPAELKLLICGKSKIDVDDLINNITITSPYTKKSKNVVLFFKAIKEWDNSDLSKLLMFVTGSSKCPAIGFKYYKDIGMPITIQPGGERNRLPQAHTCFNIIDLPEYETEDELNQKLKVAINENTYQIQ